MTAIIDSKIDFAGAMRTGILKATYQNIFLFKESMVSRATAQRVLDSINNSYFFKEKLFKNGQFTPAFIPVETMVNVVAVVLGFTQVKNYSNNVATWTPATGMGFFTKLNDMVEEYVKTYNGQSNQMYIIGCFPHQSTLTVDAIYHQLNFLKVLMNKVAETYDANGELEKEMKKKFVFISRPSLRKSVANKGKHKINYLRNDVNKRILEIESRAYGLDKINISCYGEEHTQSLALHYRRRGFTVHVREGAYSNQLTIETGLI